MAAVCAPEPLPEPRSLTVKVSTNCTIDRLPLRRRAPCGTRVFHRLCQAVAWLFDFHGSVFRQSRYKRPHNRLKVAGLPRWPAAGLKPDMGDSKTLIPVPPYGAP